MNSAGSSSAPATAASWSAKSTVSSGSSVKEATSAGRSSPFAEKELVPTYPHCAHSICSFSSRSHLGHIAFMMICRVDAGLHHLCKGGRNITDLEDIVSTGQV